MIDWSATNILSLPPDGRKASGVQEHRLIELGLRPLGLALLRVIHPPESQTLVVS